MLWFCLLPQVLRSPEREGAALADQAQEGIRRPKLGLKAGLSAWVILIIFAHTRTLLGIGGVLNPWEIAMAAVQLLFPLLLARSLKEPILASNGLLAPERRTAGVTLLGCAGALGLSLLVIWSSGVLKWKTGGPSPACVPFLSQVLLVTALANEVFYRGFLQTRLELVAGTRWGLYVAAVWFSISQMLIHPQSPIRNPGGENLWPLLLPVKQLLIGYALGRVYQKSRSVWVSAAVAATLEIADKAIWWC